MSRKSLKCQNDTQRALLHVLLASASERRKRLEALLSFSFSLFYSLCFVASRLISPLAFNLPFVRYPTVSYFCLFFSSKAYVADTMGVSNEFTIVQRGQNRAYTAKNNNNDSKQLWDYESKK